MYGMDGGENTKKGYRVSVVDWEGGRAGLESRGMGNRLLDLFWLVA